MLPKIALKKIHPKKAPFEVILWVSIFTKQTAIGKHVKAIDTTVAAPADYARFNLIRIEVISCVLYHLLGSEYLEVLVSRKDWIILSFGLFDDLLQKFI